MRSVHTALGSTLSRDATWHDGAMWLTGAPRQVGSVQKLLCKSPIGRKSGDKLGENLSPLSQRNDGQARRSLSPFNAREKERDEIFSLSAFMRNMARRCHSSRRLRSRGAATPWSRCTAIASMRQSNVSNQREPETIRKAGIAACWPNGRC